MNRSLTRRDLGTLAIAGCGAMVCGCATRSQENSRRHPAGNYVDVHTHLGQQWGDRPKLPVEALLGWMDAHSVAQAVVLPVISPEAYDYPISTHYVLHETMPHRDRLIPFCSIDPRTINLGGYEAKVALLKRYMDAGAKGFGEHKPGVAIDDPRNVELFAACSETKLPILFHLDSLRNTDKPGLPGLASVLEQVPDGVFIGHAQGWWVSISGDVTSPEQMQQYPKTKVVPGGAIDRLMDTYPNLYGDLSAGSGANAILRDLEFGTEFLIRRQDRLLFGTDFLSPTQAIPQFDLFERKLSLPAEVERKIFRENARRLLGI